MKNKSIRRLFAKDIDEGVPVPETAAPETAAPEAAEAGAGPGAAERLGRWMLDSLGPIDDGVTEDELVDAILSERTAGAADAEDREEQEEPEEGGEPGFEPTEDGEQPFEPAPRRPRPMRTGSAQSAPVDYADMSAEQFRNIRKLLKKAAADGRRIRL